MISYASMTFVSTDGVADISSLRASDVGSNSRWCGSFLAVMRMTIPDLLFLPADAVYLVYRYLLQGDRARSLLARE